MAWNRWRWLSLPGPAAAHQNFLLLVGRGLTEPWSGKAKSLPLPFHRKPPQKIIQLELRRLQPASTISGASNVSRRTRLTWDGATPLARA